MHPIHTGSYRKAANSMKSHANSNEMHPIHTDSYRKAANSIKSHPNSNEMVQVQLHHIQMKT